MLVAVISDTHRMSKYINLAKELIKTRDSLYRILAEHTGKSVEQITKDCDRDYFLTSEEAKEYKLIDNIIEKRIPIK